MFVGCCLVSWYLTIWCCSFFHTLYFLTKKATTLHLPVYWTFCFAFVIFSRPFFAHLGLFESIIFCKSSFRKSSLSILLHHSFHTRFKLWRVHSLVDLPIKFANFWICILFFTITLTLKYANFEKFDFCIKFLSKVGRYKVWIVGSVHWKQSMLCQLSRFFGKNILSFSFAFHIEL